MFLKATLEIPQMSIMKKVQIILRCLAIPVFSSKTGCNQVVVSFVFKYKVMYNVEKISQTCAVSRTRSSVNMLPCVQL